MQAYGNLKKVFFHNLNWCLFLHEVVGKVEIRLHTPGLIEKLFFLLSGMLVSVPFTLFVAGFSDYLCFVLPFFFAQICSTAIVTPFVEEFAKAYPLFYRHGETKRSLFTMGFLVGLGFGLAEFLLYVFVLEASLLVRLPGIFFHASSTSIVSYGISTKRPLRFYIVSVLLHFSINFSAILGVPAWYVGGAPAIGLTYLICLHLYQRLTKAGNITHAANASQ